MSVGFLLVVESVHPFACFFSIQIPYARHMDIENSEFLEISRQKSVHPKKTPESVFFLKYSEVTKMNVMRYINCLKL